MYYIHPCNYLPLPPDITFEDLCLSLNPNLQGAVVLHCIAMSIDISSNQNNNAQGSNVFPHQITNGGQQCLTFLRR